MRWKPVRVLLDECLPRALGRELAGHDVSTVPGMGWSGMRNGDLIIAATAEFDALITIDKLFEHRSAGASRLVVITLAAPANRLASLRPLVPGILRVLGAARPGTRVTVGPP